MAEPASWVQGVRITGPLAPFADGYRVKLRGRGYMPRSIIDELRHVARLSRWLEERQLGAADLGSERLSQFLGELPRRRDGGRVCSRRALTQVLEVLEEHGVEPLEAKEAPAPASELLLASFERFLLQERAVALPTAAAYLARTRRFLAWSAPSGEVACLRASDVTDAVLKESTAVSASATKLFVTALRSFLRFCFIEGLTQNDLSAAALSVARRRRSSLPKGIGPRVADALVRSCDRRRSKGRRDYAILLILLRLGLRAGEVAGLRLDDIDWRAGEVVVRGKGRHEDRLPLPSDVGEAIVAYLRRGRPKTTGHREVFLRGVAPLGPLGTNGISGIVRAACLRAGVPVVGARRLRHTVACQMAGTGVPLPEIGQGTPSSLDLLDGRVRPCRHRATPDRGAAQGMAEKSPFVEVTRGKRFRIRFGRRFPYELDGGARPAVRKSRIKVHPASIRICGPAKTVGGSSGARPCTGSRRRWRSG